uniref:Peptidase S1 domain-containing protein n=1 Tax=Panagrolaimus sp. JU765 TaxID=591449 RepID=A0AC34PY09_9BILA
MVSKSGELFGFNKLTASENEKLQKTCGISVFDDSDDQRFKIAEGNLAQPGQFPWVISMADSVDYVTCTGSIVSPRHILTAAHCVNKYTSTKLKCERNQVFVSTKQFYVSYGGVCTRPDSISCPKRDMKHIAVKKFAFLNDFHNRNCERGDDLAILELEKDLEFDELTRPICIINDDIRNFYDLTDLGFGQDEHKNKVAQLRFIKGDSRIIQNIGQFKNAEGHRTQPNICSGDSGGPLEGRSVFNHRHYLLGVHSYGLACGPHNDYGSTFIVHYTTFLCRMLGICRATQDQKDKSLIKFVPKKLV